MRPIGRQRRWVVLGYGRSAPVRRRGGRLERHPPPWWSAAAILASCPHLRLFKAHACATGRGV